MPRTFLMNLAGLLMQVRGILAQLAISDKVYYLNRVQHPTSIIG